MEKERRIFRRSGGPVQPQDGPGGQTMYSRVVESGTAISERGNAYRAISHIEGRVDSTLQMESMGKHFLGKGLMAQGGEGE